MSRLLRADYTSVDGVGSGFEGDLLTPEVLHAITLHPIKKPSHFFRADSFMLGRRILELRHRQLELDTEIRGGRDDDHPAPPLPRPHKRSQRYDYEMFDDWLLYSTRYDTPRRGLVGYWTRFLDEVKRQVDEKIYDTWVHRKSNRSQPVSLKKIYYGYMRLHPLDGVELIMQLERQPVRRRYRMRIRYTHTLFREDEFRDDNQSTRATYLRQFLDMFVTAKRDNNMSNNETSELVKQTLHSFNGSLQQLLMHKRAVDKVVNFIVTLSMSRWRTFERFMANFERVLLADANESSRFRLVVVLFAAATEERTVEEEERVESMFKQLRAKYSDSVNSDTLRLVVKKAPFARAVGCQLGADLLDSDDELLFFVDVDMIFTSDVLARIRLNTVQHKQVYYPTVFSEYTRDGGSLAALARFVRGRNSSSSSSSNSTDDDTMDDEGSISKRFEELRQERGFWIAHGFGMLAVYKSDLTSVGGFNTSIVGWGNEDRDLHMRFVNSTRRLEIFAGVDPGLVHVFHHMDCDASFGAEQLTNCALSKANKISAQHVLVRIIYEKQLYKIEPSPTSLLDIVNKTAT